ncbi:MAG TPA: hypothetical protein V6C58_18465 [Allocoleopsis sp.]
MNNKILLVSLLTLTTLGTLTLPGKADQAIIQETTQDTVITGNRNYSEQNSVQINIQRTRQRNNNNTGTVQRVRQQSDVAGNNNDSVQNSVQVNRTRNR